MTATISRSPGPGVSRAARSRALGPARAERTIVIGSGVAGLATALALGRCTLVTEAALGAGGSSPLAQGGVAAAVGAGDDPAAHGRDTIAVSAGLADPAVVDLVVGGGPAAISELLAIGARFDFAASGGLALGREAGHSARRIVHANGDATGAAVVSALVAAVDAAPEIHVLEQTRAVDLVTAGGQVVGALVAGPRGELEMLLAGAVVLATGGYAHCFERTTTPPSVIGTGIAMAVRAGAAVADMELVQFHPTALDVDATDRLPLLTEALRGEGAVLVNELGQRYLVAEHPDAELAPRDIVARANYRQLATGHRPYLDARQAVGDGFPERFPTVFALAARHGLDPRVDLLPVTPAAHYCMGGIAVDTRGRASLRGLWAVGETSSSGLHGANRLASNSLLEGLVMARSVAADAAGGPWRSDERRDSGVWLPSDLAHLDLAGEPDRDDPLIGELRQLLWRGAGVGRDRDGLVELLDRLDQLAVGASRSLQARTIHTVAKLVGSGALARTESRGAHFRRDYPHTDPAQAARRITSPAPVTVERSGNVTEHRVVGVPRVAG